MTVHHRDYETRSRADITDVGAFRYAEDPSTEIFCAAVAEGDEEPAIWVSPKFCFDDVQSEPGADRIIERQRQPDSLVYAHNAQFEYSISVAKGEPYGLSVGIHQWRCTAAMARRANIPASLEKAAATLGIEQQKDTKGKSLIRKFSIPRKDGTFLEPWEAPEDFKAFLAYCKQDVRVEQQIHRELSAFELTGPVLDTFLFDMAMNSRGLPVNVEALRHAQSLIDETEARLTTEFRNLTGFNHTQRNVLLAWLKQNGYKGNALTAADMAEEMADDGFDPESVVGRALTIRKMLSYASIKKVRSMLACACSDGRVRGTIQFYGAQTTGRRAGRLVQPQNFKRPTIKNTKIAYAMISNGEPAAWLESCFGAPVLEIISSCIRHFIHDTKGPMFDVDYAAIEARILAWLAGEDWKLEVFRTHGKIYEATASRMTGVPFEEFERHLKEKGEHHPFRFKGKVAELALGYQGAVGALEVMGAVAMGMAAEELPEVVKAWRAVNPNIVKFWYALERAAKSAIKSPGSKFDVRNVTLFCSRTAGANYLFLRLPSGRRLAYRDPQVREEAVTDREGNLVYNADGSQQTRDKISYYGQVEGKAMFGRVSLYGGKLAENATQAVAADVMDNGSINADRAGFEAVTLVHDQYIGLNGTKERLPILNKCLTTLPPWGAGLPVAVDGKVVEFYTK